MARNRDDDAKNWSMGDMQRDQAEVSSVNEPEWLVEAQDELTEAQYAKNIDRLRRNAARNGMVVGIQKRGSKYQVSIERKNPRYKGGRKGAGKRKFT